MGQIGRISVIIPTKNEGECIRAVLSELMAEALHEVIVVDAGSSDGTQEIARECGVKVIQQQGRGYGAALNTALPHATGDYITFFDADGSYNPCMLPLMQARLEAGDEVVFCSRYLPESASEDDTLVRLIGNKIFTLALRILHGVRITDALFLYVLAKRSIFSDLQMTSTGFDWCIEFPIRVHTAGFRYSEMPTTERARIAGDSKVNAFSDGLVILSRVIKSWFELRLGRLRPRHVHGS